MPRRATLAALALGSAVLLAPAWVPCPRQIRPRPRRVFRCKAAEDREAPDEEERPEKPALNKKEMLRFAVPALGISVANPLMSNIDNAFIGQIEGTAALAALNPGSVLADYVLYLFIFMPRATTGLVARAWAKNNEEAREELGRAISAALFFGTIASVATVTFAGQLLGLLGVPEALKPAAAGYARIRGLVTWATLAQACALSGLLATRDSLTPLKVVAVAAFLNLTGDFLLCKWPLRLGVAGAAGATALSTLAGFALMLAALRRKGLLVRPRWQTRQELQPLFSYAKPLAVVVATRMFGLTLMALTANSLGILRQAAYQVLVNITVLFGLMGEPLSQTAQALLPGLLDAGKEKAKEIRSALKNLATLAAAVAVFAGAASTLVLMFGSGLFSQDPAVQQIVSRCWMVPVCISSLVFAMMVDGSLIAAKEFNVVIRFTLCTTFLQTVILYFVMKLKLDLSFVFMSLAIRYWVVASGTAFRTLTGRGPLGRAVRASG